MSLQKVNIRLLLFEPRVLFCFFSILLSAWAQSGSSASVSHTFPFFGLICFSLIALMLNAVDHLLLLCIDRVATDHNEDNTTAVLRDWLVKVQNLYHYVEWRPKEEPRWVTYFQMSFQMNSVVFCCQRAHSADHINLFYKTISSADVI